MAKSKEKEIRTNAMRMLDKLKIPYKVNTYECEEFIDAIHISDMLGQPYETVFKTLVTVGKSGEHYVFVIPIHKELNMKQAARCVGEKDLQLLPTRLLLATTGYIRGGCTAIGMKKAFPTVIDESAATLAKMIVSGGRIGSQIVLAPADFIRAVNGRFEAVCA
ncbi:MAG: Cys-tRNA(Pro) deacylase [Clostridia bacterium]|nr:Cys-tRNA(Pro) deacylase [Clostridia bacterium]